MRDGRRSTTGTGSSARTPTSMRTSTATTARTDQRRKSRRRRPRPTGPRPSTTAARPTCARGRRPRTHGRPTRTTVARSSTTSSTTFHDWLDSRAVRLHAASGAFEGGDRLRAQTMFAAQRRERWPARAAPTTRSCRRRPTGSRRTMSMFLWTAPNRRRDSADDASVVFHEYTHGLSNRLVTDGEGKGALNSPQADAMGEGWSDWYALDYLVEHCTKADTAAPGELEVGRLRKRRQRHAQRGDRLPRRCGPCPVRSGGPGGYTYGDFGRAATFTNEHTNGEIWAQTLWDLRSALDPRPVARGGDHRRHAPVAARPVDARACATRSCRPTRRLLGGDNRTPSGRSSPTAAWGTSRSRTPATTRRRARASPFPAPGTVASPAASPTRRPGAPVANALVRLASTATGFPGDLTGVSDANGNYRIDKVVPGTYPATARRRHAATRPASRRTSMCRRRPDRSMSSSSATGPSAAGGGAVTRSTGPNFGACPATGAIDSSHVTGWGSTSHEAADPGLAEARRRSRSGCRGRSTCRPSTSIPPRHAATTRARRPGGSGSRPRATASASPRRRPASSRPRTTTARTSSRRPPARTAVQFVRYTMLEPQRQGTDERRQLHGHDRVRGLRRRHTGRPPRPAAAPGRADPDRRRARRHRSHPPASRRCAVVSRQRLRTALAKGMKIVGRVQRAVLGAAQRPARRADRQAARAAVAPQPGEVGPGRARHAADGRGPPDGDAQVHRKARRLLESASAASSCRSAAALTDRSGNTRTRDAKVTLRR